ncbi:TenA family protein [Salinarimonas rosea]|uniref:TenA family protein n=1 Tax=Salinarimonas rosea TaxID=552063 RepID=UPI000421F823|nr:TenA family protein [Salinarimonas rosea]
MDEPLSERILRENRAVLEAMLNHRFVCDVAHDRLPPAVFDRYLVFEGAFVDTAVAIFAYATAKARTVAQRRVLVGVLDALVNRQIGYFERTFAARGIDPARFDTSLAPVVAFREGMLAIAMDGSYADIVTAMFAAEWMYWSWCRRASACAIADPLLAEWVALHVADDFAAQAAWLKSELDAAAADLDEPEKVRLSAVFGQVQELEIAFHDAPYPDTNDRGPR